MSTPASMCCVAAVWRSMCGVTRWEMPAALAALARRERIAAVGSGSWGGWKGGGVREIEFAARLQIGLGQAGYPVVGQEDLSLAATLAHQSNRSAWQVDVLVSEANDLMHANAGGHHQGDGKKCRGLVGSFLDESYVDGAGIHACGLL